MTSPDSSPGSRPIPAKLLIRRGEIRGGEVQDRQAVCEAAWRLADASATAAHWLPEAFFPYLTVEAAGGSLQAKALFVAFAGTAAGISPLARDGSLQAAMQIVGFAAFSAITSLGAGECTLENMAVAEAWQRQGIGVRLLAAGMLWCRAHAARSMFLEVRETNQAAIALYERAGFAVIGRRPGYYGDPVEAALQMQKLLVHVA